MKKDKKTLENGPWYIYKLKIVHVKLNKSISIGQKRKREGER